MISLLTISAPAAPETIRGIAANTTQELRFRLITSSLLTGFPRWFGALLTGTSTISRTPTVQIRVFPGDITIREDTDAVLAAVGYDSENEPISGLEFTWTWEESTGRIPQRSFNGGIFHGDIPGVFTITAQSGGQQGQVTVTVLARDPEEAQFFEGKNTVQTSSRRGVESGKKSSADQTNSLLPGDGWNNDNWLSADNPGNLPGNPPGGPIDGGAGNGNFQLSAPVISIPGRGVDVALNLNYNSRLWNKAGNELTYDIDYGEPAGGWSLGFGKIQHMGSDGGCMLVDADGTRHGYTGSVTTGSNSLYFTGRTADGSFIDYGCNFNYGNYGSGWSKLPNGTSISYSSVTATELHLHPTLITDAQGNFISITYRNASGNALIETVTDTMGRVITFHYDNLDRLIEVRAPRMQDQDPIYGGAKTRTVVRLHYRPLTLSYSFGSGITPVVRQSTVQVIDAIYYPGTKTGYWFGDSDSYSSYGMITKVLEQRGMDWQTSVEEQGTVIAGSMTKQADYNYPLTTTNASGRTNGTGLIDAPTYTTLKESWAGRDVQEDAITIYSVNENVTRWDGFNQSPAREITVTQPSGVISKQYSYNLPSGGWNNGLVFNDETIVMNGSTPTVISSSLVAWQEGNYESPRPYWAKVWDEKGDQIRTEYEYSTNKFNQITKSCDFDDANVKLRCATAEYENSSNYIGQFNTSGKFISGRHIFNLVTKSAVENDDGTKASLTEYEYDNYTNNPLVNTPGVIQHKQDHNPFNTGTYACNCRWSCDPEGVRLSPEESPHFTEECPEGGPPTYYICDTCFIYDQSTSFRGNITRVTYYTDAQTQTGPIFESRTYDITGNLVGNSAACCEQKSYVYTDATQYAYPESSTHGAADPQSPHRVTSTAMYSYETGLVKQATDSNGLTSTSWYDPDTLRPVKSISSTGAYSTVAYDDAAMTIEEEVREYSAVGQGTLAGRSKKYLNGIGLVVKEESFAPNGIVDIVETKYTKFGEAWKQSRPYRNGDTVHWSEKFYDDQRRLIKVVDPDGSETKAFYNETAVPDSVTATPGNTIRIADAWGRERWGRYDQQGRLVHVVEPNPDKTANPNGKVISVAGSLLTKYKYDTLGRLVETEQGVQLRKFKYDSLGRLTRQKLAEQTATLNDAGAFVGSGGSGAAWSEAFVYDNRSNLIQKTGARGVRTNYSFQVSGNDDPLNRIQSRSYDLSGPLQSGLTIHQAPTVNYEYMTTGDKTRIKKIRTDGFLTEDYTYDGESRVNEYKQTVDYRTSYPMTTSYVYDSLDRVKEVHYPAQYGLSGSPRKIVAHSYDTAGRVTQMTYGGAVQASEMVFNAADQTTSIKIGAAGTNQVTENYTFDPQTGLLTNQVAIKNGSTTLLDLSYEYNRLGSAGDSGTGKKTGHLTKIVDNLNTAKNREYEFDAVGRLTKAKGGIAAGSSGGGADWTQSYTYDRYGNRTSIVGLGTAADSSTIPVDGIPSLTYDDATNRITTPGFEYDVAGNQIKAPDPSGNSLLFEYDAANRIQIIKKVSDGSPVQSFQYGSTNARLMDFDNAFGKLKIFASTGGTTLAEYTEYIGAVPTWTKSYTYLGDSQLGTVTPNGTGGEYVEFNHPDRLGTKLQTNQAGGTSYEQNTLPFGIALNAESSLTTNNKRFTSYDRSSATGLDYAINRTYDSKQGRFTQVDPIGMSAASLASPQTLNMYTYCGNDPINYVDPTGLFFGSLFKWVVRIFKLIVAAILVVAAVLSFASGNVIGGIEAALQATQLVADVFNLKALQKIVAIASIAVSIIRIRAGAASATPPIFPLGQIQGSNGIDPGYITIFASVGAITNSFVARTKKKRPGRFRTVDQAAIAFLKIWVKRSIKLNAEINVSICEIIKTGELVYSTIVIGKEKRSSNPSCDSDSLKVGTVHTHGAPHPEFNDEDFSKFPGDRVNANNRSVNEGRVIPTYLGTPSGVIKKFTPAVIKNSIRGRITTFKSRARI